MSENRKLLIENVETDPLPAVAITYKDRIFRMVFKHKEEFLSLYNAMSGTHYTNPDDLTVSTLDNAIYLGMKNDVSFVLYDRLMLYEHQATRNPNMPLRNLFYAADVYSRLTRDQNLFGTKLIKIPEPKFVVFYNGIDKMPEISTLRLSDMFENASEHPALELTTQVYNINLGYNKELMKNCKALHDYAVFVNLVRTYQRKMPLKAAINSAIDECMVTGILADFLKANKAEVLKMGLYEYDEEKHIRMEREDAREEGQRKERETSIINIIKTSQELGSSIDDTAQRLKKMYALTECEVKTYIQQYWKVTL